MCWIPEHGTLVTADGGRELVYWVVGTAEKLWTVKTGYEIRSLCFVSPDQIISGDEGGNLTIWDLSGTQRQQLSCGSMVMSVIHAPDLDAMLCGCLEGEVLFWDTSFTEKRSTIMCEDHLMGLCYASECGALVTADGQFCKATVWDAVSGEKRQELHCDDWVVSVAYAADLQVVIAGDEGHKVTMWDVNSGLRRWEVTCGGPVHTIAYEQSMEAVIANDMDEVSIWNVSTGLLRERIPGTCTSRSRDGLRSIIYTQSGEIIQGDFWGRVSFWPVRRPSKATEHVSSGPALQPQSETESQLGNSASVAVPASTSYSPSERPLSARVGWPSEQFGIKSGSSFVAGARSVHQWPSEQLGSSCAKEQSGLVLGLTSATKSLRWPSEQLGASKTGYSKGKSPGWPSEQLQAMNGFFLRQETTSCRRISLGR